MESESFACDPAIKTEYNRELALNAAQEGIDPPVVAFFYARSQQMIRSIVDGLILMLIGAALLYAGLWTYLNITNNSYRIHRLQQDKQTHARIVEIR